MSRMTIKKDDGTYGALTNGYEEGATERERHFNDLVQKLGQYEDIAEDPEKLKDIFYIRRCWRNGYWCSYNIYWR